MERVTSGTRQIIHLPSKLLCHLRMEVLHSSAFTVVICPGTRDDEGISFSFYPLTCLLVFVFANTNTASSDAFLKPLIRLIFGIILASAPCNSCNIKYPPYYVSSGPSFPKSVLQIRESSSCFGIRQLCFFNVKLPTCAYLIT